MKLRFFLAFLFLSLVTLVVIFALRVKPDQVLKNTQIPSPSSPSADTTLSFSPNSLFLTQGTTGSLDILIDTGNNKVTNVQLEIGYDPLLLSIISIQPGDFFPSPNVLFENNIIRTGRLSYALGVATDEEAVMGKGKVATLTFQKNPNAFAQSQTTIAFFPKTLISAVDIQGTVLKAAENAIIVIPASIPTATPSALPGF